MAEVLRPHRCCRTTRQGVRRTPKAQGGCQYAVVLTPLPDLAPATVAAAYDRRALLEAPLGQDQPARGLVKRRQHKWEAQHMGLL
jgi:hypothetical protein